MAEEERPPSIPPTTPVDESLSSGCDELRTRSSADGSGVTLCVCCSQTSQLHVCTCDVELICECFDEKKPVCICDGNICTCEAVPREVCICYSGEPTEKSRHVCDTCVCAQEYEPEEEAEEEPCLSGQLRDSLGVQDRVQKYLRTRHVFEFVDFMMRHLLAATPKKPIPFLIELLDACMYFRAGLKEPPLLFGELHLQAVVKSFDPADTGFLTAGQYRRAFQAVGACDYPQPTTTRVPATLFSSAALHLLTHRLAAALTINPEDELPACICPDNGQKPCNYLHSNCALDFPNAC